MTSTELRREAGGVVHLTHKYYGKFKFRETAPLADAAAASAEVFAGERTDGCAPTRAARARHASARVQAAVRARRGAHARAVTHSACVHAGNPMRTRRCDAGSHRC